MEKVYNTTPLVQTDGDGGHAIVTFPQGCNAVASNNILLIPNEGQNLLIHWVGWSTQSDPTSAHTLTIGSANYYVTSKGPGILNFNPPIASNDGGGVTVQITTDNETPCNVHVGFSNGYID